MWKFLIENERVYSFLIKVYKKMTSNFSLHKNVNIPQFILGDQQNAFNKFFNVPISIFTRKWRCKSRCNTFGFRALNGISFLLRKHQNFLLKTPSLSTCFKGDIFNKTDFDLIKLRTFRDLCIPAAVSGSTPNTLIF